MTYHDLEILVSKLKEVSEKSHSYNNYTYLYEKHLLYMRSRKLNKIQFPLSD